jgi:hypothetical protein
MLSRVIEEFHDLLVTQPLERMLQLSVPCHGFEHLPARAID